MSIVKSFSVGDGDMFYVAHNSDNFTIIDCCMTDEDKELIVAEIRQASVGKGVTRYISTHPDDDHIRGLVYLNQEIGVTNFYCVRNEATKDDDSTDFDEYCSLRDDAEKSFYIYKGCKRKWMNDSDEERGAAGIHIYWPITSNLSFVGALQDAKNSLSPNNISPIIQYKVEDSAKILWMGDLESEFMEEIISDITPPRCDVLFAPHHGRNSGKVPDQWLESINPKLIIIGEAPSTHLNYYSGYNTITQNSAGAITLDCDTGKIHIYVSSEDYSVDFLNDERKLNTYDNYIGSLML